MGMMMYNMLQPLVPWWFVKPRAGRTGQRGIRGDRFLQGRRKFLICQSLELCKPQRMIGWDKAETKPKLKQLQVLWSWRCCHIYIYIIKLYVCVCVCLLDFIRLNMANSVICGSCPLGWIGFSLTGLLTLSCENIWTRRSSSISCIKFWGHGFGHVFWFTKFRATLRKVLHRKGMKMDEIFQDHLWSLNGWSIPRSFIFVII